MSRSFASVQARLPSTANAASGPSLAQRDPRRRSIVPAMTQHHRSARLDGLLSAYFSRRLSVP